jgi:hypothetical protein
MFNKIIISSVAVISAIALTTPATSDDGIKCPPLETFRDCTKEVTQWFKGCADSVTHAGIFKNDEDLQRCKEIAKKKNDLCKKTCKKQARTGN